VRPHRRRAGEHPAAPRGRDHQLVRALPIRWSDAAAMTKEHLLERWRDHTYLHPRTYERACLEAMQWVIDNDPYAFDRLTRNRFPDHATRLESVELEGHYPKAWLVLTFLHEASGVRA